MKTLAEIITDMPDWMSKPVFHRLTGEEPLLGACDIAYGVLDDMEQRLALEKERLNVWSIKRRRTEEENRS